jgi:hypothetical protein
MDREKKTFFSRLKSANGLFLSNCYTKILRFCRIYSFLCYFIKEKRFKMYGSSSFRGRGTSFGSAAPFRGRSDSREAPSSFGAQRGGGMNVLSILIYFDLGFGSAAPSSSRNEGN